MIKSNKLPKQRTKKLNGYASGTKGHPFPTHDTTTVTTSTITSTHVL